MATVSGGLIAESLRVGTPLEGVALSVEKISRADARDVTAGQPLTWTTARRSRGVRPLTWRPRVAIGLAGVDGASEDERQGSHISVGFLCGHA